MNPSDGPSPELRDLLIEITEHGVTPDLARRLADLLRDADDATVDLYLDYIALHANLSRTYTKPPAQVAPSQVRPPATGSKPRGAAPSGGRTPGVSRRMPTAYALAAALLLTAAALAIYVFIIDPQAEIRDPKSDGPPIATLIDSTGTVIYQDDIASPGSEYPAGSYFNDSGSAEFLLDSRVTVNLRGKTRLVIHNPMSASLESGLASFNCPRGAEGFTVHLPDRSKIVDLGTAFDVEIDDAGTPHLRVSEGVVEWTPPGESAKAVRIVGGQVARMIDGRPVVEHDLLRIDLEMAGSPAGQQTQSGWTSRQIESKHNGPSQLLVDAAPGIGVTASLETDGPAWQSRGGSEQARAQLTGTPLDDVLEDLWSTRTGTARLTLSGLTPGTTYTLEAWHNDSYAYPKDLSIAGFASGEGAVTPSIVGGHALSITPGAITHRRGAQSDGPPTATRLVFEAVDESVVITLTSDNPNGHLPINGFRLRAESDPKDAAGRSTDPPTSDQ